MSEEEGGDDEDVRSGLFQDPDFPADDSSLFSDRSTPIASLRGHITWLRPQEICPAPRLLAMPTSRGQARQGLLGDCWLLCACTTLLENRHLLDKVLPPHQPQWGSSRYRGSFLLRLWKNGLWTEVTVDDRLPCVGGKLCFSRCQAPDAFWVSLLEKAHAKLHGSYERLWAGQVSEALVDLTGGLAERWNLEHAGKEEDQDGGQGSDRVRGSTRKLDLDFLQAVREGCSVSCSTHSAPTGGSVLEQHHALNVMEWLDVRTASGGAGREGGAKGEGGEEVVRLLRIRNPWGRRCGGGAWIEGGEGWQTLEPASSLELLSRAEEGEVWLDHTEFLAQFDDVTVGYPINKDGHLQSIYTGELLTHSHQLSGRWVKGHSAGGCRNNSSYGSNPKFWLRVCERGEVLVSLLQHWRPGRTAQYPCSPAEGATHARHHQAIAIHMWKVKKKRVNVARTLNKAPCASTRCHAYEREVIMHTRLEPGFHMVIPSCFHQGAEASFTLRVFSSGPTSLSALKAPGPSLPLVTGEWETVYFRGAWVTGSSAGGGRNFLSHWRNPRFPVVVGDHVAGTPGVNVQVTLRQNHPDTDLQPIGFHLYTAPEKEGESEPSLPRDKEPVASCVPHCYTQDVSLACYLPPGAYVIVPSTYQPDCPGHFTLTVARRILRRVVLSQERLGRTIEEVSHISLMSS
ncbi:calpain-10 [Osmerus mordax]|uniref:calpain-10 n=1 Tax=Osmerus mordax TaxID=8014 RepID=UPI00350F95FC